MIPELHTVPNGIGHVPCTTCTILGPLAKPSSCKVNIYFSKNADNVPQIKTHRILGTIDFEDALNKKNLKVSLINISPWLAPF